MIPERELIREEIRKRRVLRGEVVEMLGGECSRCGIQRRLDVHHVDEDGGSHRLMAGSRFATYREILRGDYPSDKVTVLCRDCHDIVHGKTVDMDPVAARWEQRYEDW